MPSEDSMVAYVDRLTPEETEILFGIIIPELRDYRMIQILKETVDDPIKAEIAAQFKEWNTD